MKGPYIIRHLIRPMLQLVDGLVTCNMVDKICGHEHYDALASPDCHASAPWSNMVRYELAKKIINRKYGRKDN